MNQLMRLRTPITDALGSARPVTGGEGSASDEPQPTAANAKPVTGGEGSASDEPQPTAAKAQRTPTEAM